MLTIALSFALVPALTQAEEMSVTYVYYQVDDENKLQRFENTENATPVTSQTTSMGTAGTDTYYVVNEDVTVSNRIAVSGHVHLILADGKNLTAQRGIQVSPLHTLSIYGQTENTGTISASFPSKRLEDAVIGGNNLQNAGTIAIHGGLITATKGSGAGACIGGGSYGDGGNISIYGGTVKVQNNDSSGAGIGGGISGDGGSISIYGGTVISENHWSNPVGAAIGGGSYGDGGNISIYGGKVTAKSNTTCAAGIGGGDRGSAGNITISGGYIEASSGSAYKNGYGASIGAGYNSSAQGSISISGGTIIVSAPHQVVGIGSNIDDHVEITITGGDITVDADEQAYSVLPKIDPSFAHAKIWYGENEAAATAAGAKFPNEFTDGHHAQKYVRIKEGYAILFHSNTDNPTTIRREYALNSSSQLTNSFTRKGYEFVCWNTQADGSGDEYLASDEFSEAVDAHTLYAQWKSLIPISITFGGTYQTVYEVGDAFDPTGMTVTITYQDGRTATFESDEITASNGFTISPASLQTSDIDVTISYRIGGNELAAMQRVLVGFGFSKQPQDQRASTGKNVVFSIEATGNDLKYQWEVNRNDGLGWSVLENATNEKLTVTATLDSNGSQYRCRITDASQNTLLSDAAVLHVFVLPNVPQTGDASTPMLWLLLAGLSLTGIAILTAMGKRRA